MKIIKGKIPHAKKFTIYGSEGIGKSTFATNFPEPIFIDTEGSTKEMEVARFEKPTSWTMLLEQIKHVKNHPDICKTLVIDTIDWAEQMCVEHVCDTHQKSGLESFGYGSGYIYVREEFGRFLNRLEEVVEAGVNVVLIAHAQLRKFEQPDELGAYDRWELKLGKKTSSQTSPLVKEWSDALLFANYKTISVAADDKGKKHKAQGGRRVMYASHHPCWDAKNRYGLPEELPFEYASIAHIIGGTVKPVSGNEASAAPPKKTEAAPPAGSAKQPGKTEPPEEKPVPENNKDSAFYLDEQIPKSLRDLMVSNCVAEEEIRAVVAARGYLTEDIPVREYEKINPGFIGGVLVGAWPKVHEMIKEMREKQEIPFN